MDELEKIKLKKLIEELKNYRALHTELISLYIPSGGDINSVKDQINKELGTAQNIKSRTTRKNVLDALQKIALELKKYNKTPPNGLIIFCGNVSGKEGVSDVRLFAIHPPAKLNIRLYRCDQKFVIEPLEDLLKAKHVYGVVIVDRGEATIGIIHGKTTEVLWHDHSMVPGKTRKGGQSSVRFQSQRELQEKNWYREVADKMKSLFSQYKNLKGIILAGTFASKDRFFDQAQLNQEWKKKIIAKVDVQYHGINGMNEVLEKVKDILKDEEIVEEAEEVKKFFENVAKGGLVTYGYEEVKRALELGNCSKVLISETLDESKLNEIVELAKKYNAEVRIISKDSYYGKMFSNFQIGCYLRYKM